MPMNLPDLYEENSSKVKTEVFAGLNRATRIGDGEFHDMQNLSSDEFPVLSVRERRRRYMPLSVTELKYPDDPSELFTAAANGFGISNVCYLERYEEDGAGGYGMVVNGCLVKLDLVEDETIRRSVVRMGVYAIVLPDMVYVNTIDLSDYGSISDSVVLTSSGVDLSVVDSDDNEPDYISNTEPTGDIENGALWYKTSTTASGAGLYRYNAEEGAWKKEKPYVYVGFRAAVLNMAVSMTFKKPIRAGHTIKLENVHDALDGVRVITSVNADDGDPKKIWGFSVEGIIGSDQAVGGTAAKPITIGRPIPKLDFACEAGNRIWGCHYENGTTDLNEIYCCARGDFYRWIQGASDDPDAPVTFSIGSDGAWTGAICYNGYPTFFQESVVYRVSGTGASGYAVYDTACAGVRRGCEGSLAIVNNILYYKSRGHVMAFDGSAPVAVSEKLGRLTAYTKAVGGACGDKYYLSLWKNGGQDSSVLYVLDTARGLWHKEDDTYAECMVSVGDALYMSVHNTKTVSVYNADTGETVSYVPRKVILVVGGDAGEYAEGAVSWYAETGVIGMESEEAKYLSKIVARLSMDVGSSVRISAQYDSVGTFKQLMAVEADRMKVVTLPILPVRCDHLRLRLEGVGGCRLFSLTKIFETAEDL